MGVSSRNLIAVGQGAAGLAAALAAVQAAHGTAVRVELSFVHDMLSATVSFRFESGAICADVRVARGLFLR